MLYSLTAPARFQKLPFPLLPGPLPARRSPHPAAKRFVQAAFRIGFAMRKALSICVYLLICVSFDATTMNFDVNLKGI